jgi:uncharacterized protein (TIGR03382 family)
VTLPQGLVNGVYHVGLWVPQLATDADTTNVQVVSANTVAITGGFANATVRDASASRRSGGGGGGCTFGQGAGGPGPVLPFLALLSLVALRWRRRIRSH